MGRPSKCTTEMIEKAAALVTAGQFEYAVAEYLGIGERTWYRWLKQGEEESSGIYHEFRQAIVKARMTVEMRCVELITQAAATDWRAACWWLERRFPAVWGRRTAHRVEGGPITITNKVQEDLLAKIDKIIGVNDQQG